MLQWMWFLGFLAVFFQWQIGFAQGANFTFDYGPAGQCDDFQISWKGGFPPFTLTIVPSNGTQQTFAIPDSSYNNGEGAFSTPMTHMAGLRVLAVLSDETGFGSGGVSPIITVGPSTSGRECNATESYPEFTFLNGAHVTECSPYMFSYFLNAVLPVTITGMIPAGQAFYVLVGGHVSDYTWMPDLAPDTTVIFMMEDAKGRTGGAALLTPVNPGDDSCLKANSPSSQAVAPSSTASQSMQTGSGLPRHSNIGPLAGGISAGVVGLLVIVGLVWFCIRRRKRNGIGDVYSYDYRLEETNLIKGNAPTSIPSTYNSEPSVTSGPHWTTIHALSSAYNGGQVEIHYPYPQNGATAVFRHYPPAPSPAERVLPAPRQTHRPVIVHRDMEDEIPGPEDAVIELPPQYSERRAPRNRIRAVGPTPNSKFRRNVANIPSRLGL